MPNQTAAATSALFASIGNCLKRSYLRRVAKATLDYDFEESLTHLRRVDICEVGLALNVRLSIERKIVGETPLLDLVALCTLVCADQPRSIFEFGTFTGNATLHMAMNAPDAAVLHTLDLGVAERSVLQDLRPCSLMTTTILLVLRGLST